MIKTQFHSKLIFIVISILLISAFSPAHILSDHSSGMAPPDEDNNTGGNGTGYFNQTWYIDASDDLAYANQSLILSGDLIINNSGRLVLSNFTLAINSSFNGQFRIIVEPGGILEIHSNSTISILNESNRFEILVRPGATFVLNGSNISSCGWDTAHPGLVIDWETANKSYSNSMINGSTFSDCYSGITLKNLTKELVLSNNTIFNNDFAGISLIDCNNTNISFNGISDQKYGIYASNSTANAYDNHIFNNTAWGIYTEGETVLLHNDSFTNESGMLPNGFGRFWQEYFLSIQVFESATILPVSDAFVNITDKFGRAVSITKTDSAGQSNGLNLTSYRYYNDDSTTIFSPHNVTIEKDGFESVFAEPEPNMVDNLAIQINLTPATPPPEIDYIVIETAAGGGKPWAGPVVYGTGKNDVFYCAGYNDTVGFVTMVNGTWSSSDGDIASVSPWGNFTTMEIKPVIDGGAVKITAEYNGLTNNSGLHTILPAVEDYIIIVYSSGGFGGWVDSHNLPLNNNETFYCAVLNNTIGYLYNGEANWSSQNPYVGTVTSPGDSTLFSGIIVGDTIVSASYTTKTSQNLTNETGMIHVVDYTIDRIIIRSAAGGAGTWISGGKYTELISLKLYCAAYNNSFGFLKDEIANWALIGDNIGYFSTYSGAWTDFIITGSGSIYITANVDGHGNLTGLLSITALLPDLEITAVDITFSPDDSELEQKKATLVDILVRNLGGTANLVCSVDVYDVRPPNDDIIKIYSYSLGPFYAYQTLSFNFTWTPTVIGTHGILVLLDADNKIIESLESNNQAERTIEVVPFVPDLVDIEVEPKSTKIEAGEVFQFLAYGIFEDESSRLLLENEVRWNATGGASVNSTGHFHSLKSGSYNITASSSSIGKSRIKNTSKAYVEPGPLEYIEVYPTIIDLDVGMSKKFSAKGFDQYYNEVPISPSWRVTGGGKINQVGEFRAEDEGSWKVIAEVLNINGSATVRVNPVTLDIEKLMLFPSKLVILINHDYRFNAIGADSKGNEHSVQPLWSTTGGGELDLNGIFNATTEGRWTITASFGEFKATSEVIVVTRSSQEHLESFFDPRTGISVTASFLGTGTILINRVDIFDMFMTSPANMVTLGMFIEIIATANMVINWARIFMPYNPNNIPSENSDLESSLKLYTWSEAEKSWTETDQSGVNLNNKIVYGNVSHLSVFAPMVQLSKPVKDDDGISNSTIAAIFLTIFIPVIFVIFVIMNKKGVSFSPFGRQGGRDRMVKPIVVIRHKRQIRREIDEDEELEE